MTDSRPERTRTSSFGVSSRNGHDSSPFYERFEPPLISDDTEINWNKKIDRIFRGDARNMSHVADNSVALAVTSPPYFVGKEYELDIADGVTPSSYSDYLRMLEEVFAETVRKLEPGGRIAVNVANLGRRPYRSLSSDVIQIFERLKLLLRGEVIWVKGRGASGSTAWGSFQSPANPVLRDLTERVIIASKGRFDRVLSAKQRAAAKHPNAISIWRDEFMEATTDVWEIPPESATRVGHPAPFPVALPKRLIDLYTYEGDLVLDPFMGSGTTAVAAVQRHRHYVGYDLSEAYCRIARARIREEGERISKKLAEDLPRLSIPGLPPPSDGNEDFQARAVREGKAVKDITRATLTDVGFLDIEDDVKLGAGVEANLVARDQQGGKWFFDVSGGFTSSRPGLARTDTMWKALGKAVVLQTLDRNTPLVLLTTNRPRPRSSGEQALQAATGPGKPVYDIIEILDLDDLERLQTYAREGRPSKV